MAASWGQRYPVNRVQSLTKHVQTEYILVLGFWDYILNPQLQLTGTGSNKSPHGISTQTLVKV